MIVFYACLQVVIFLFSGGNPLFFLFGQARDAVTIGELSVRNSRVEFLLCQNYGFFHFGELVDQISNRVFWGCFYFFINRLVFFSPFSFFLCICRRCTEPVANVGYSFFCCRRVSTADSRNIRFSRTLDRLVFLLDIADSFLQVFLFGGIFFFRQLMLQAENSFFGVGVICVRLSVYFFYFLFNI